MGFFPLDFENVSQSGEGGGDLPWTPHSLGWCECFSIKNPMYPEKALIFVVNATFVTNAHSLLKVIYLKTFFFESGDPTVL
jgi:hypothetical protein